MEEQLPPLDLDTPNNNPPQNQYSPPPTYSPPQQYPPPQAGMSGPFDAMTNPIRFYSAERIPKLIAFGIFFMILGSILIVLVTATGGPNVDDAKYDNNYDLLRQDRLMYDTVKDIGVAMGKIFFNIGMVFLILALVIGGLVNQNLEKQVRIALIIAGAFILAWVGFMF